MVQLLWEWDEIAIQEFLSHVSDLNINREALFASREIKVLDGRNVQAGRITFITANHFAKSNIITITTKKRVDDQQSMRAELIFEQKIAEERIRYLEEKVRQEEYPMDMENEY